MESDNIPESLRRLIQQQVDDYNNQANPDFEGYSPKEITYLIYDPFHPDSPIRFNNLSVVELEQIPLFRQVYYLASLINEFKEIKLTATGKLPLKIVADIRSRRFLTDNKEFEIDYKKVFREDDSYSITLSRLLLEVCGITQKSVKKLVLKRKGIKLLSDKSEFFRVIFEKYTQRFNWAYGDRFLDELTGQLGWAYSIALVAKYGKQPRTVEFYSEKYFQAFPHLLKSFESEYFIKASSYCYALRVFSHFMEYFGLVKLEYPKDFMQPVIVKRLPFFEKLVTVRT